MLAARLDLLEKKPDDAERRLLDIVQAQPSRLDAYELLGEIVSQARSDRFGARRSTGRWPATRRRPPVHRP